MKRKEMVLNKLNQSLELINDLKETMYNGKTFVVVGNRIKSSYKTKRGAAGYIKRQSQVSYYSESSFEMVNCGEGLEIVEIKETELPNLENNYIFWFECIKNEYRGYNTVNNAIKAMKRTIKNIEVISFMEAVGAGLIENNSISAEHMNFIKGLENKEAAADQEVKEAVATEGIIVNFNEEKKGIEITFTSKPSEKIREELKVNGFRWHRIKKVWYAKETESRKEFVNSLVAPSPAAAEEIKEEIREDKIKPFTAEEMKYTNDIVNTIIEMNWELKEIFIGKDNCIYGKVLKSNGKIEIEGLYAPSHDLKELKGVYRCLDSKIVKDTLIEGMELVADHTTAPETREEKKISFENVRAEEIKEEIKVKVLTPAVSKNNTKKENDKFIQERSNVDTVKITHVVKLSSEQYEKFTNTFLTDYDFLQGLGGYEEDDNGKYLYSLGVLVVAAGQENLVIDPSGFSYARYVSKIVEGHELEKINIKIEDSYSKKIDEIKEDAFYIYKVENKKEIITDDRIILNRAHNDLTLITGLTIKEKIKEGKNINVYTLKPYTGDISDYKEDLKRNIVTLFGDMFDSAIDRTDFTTRLNKEIKRASIKTA